MALRFLLGSAAAIAALVTVVPALETALRDDLSGEDLARVRAVTAPAADFSTAEPFEAMQAGAATSRAIVNANAFSHASANLDFEGLESFLLGNGIFRRDWVSAPSSTQASDGLGPLFNARACQSCHIKDGRGHLPAGPEDSTTSLLVRLSVPPDAEQSEAIAAGALAAAPDPVYGIQLQDFAVAGLAAEARIVIDYEEQVVELTGGESVTLRRPVVTLADPGYGPFHPELMTSLRVASPMIGLGLIEAIHEADILANADPDDLDGDGISGRPNYVLGPDGELVLGRFGWKAIEPDVLVQSANAFSMDMGLSTPPAPDHWGDCTAAQPECLAMPHGAQPAFGAHEVPGELLDLVAFYSRNLAVPVRRDVGDPGVLDGKQLFYETGCTSCHTPSYVTRRDAENPAHRFQLIWPYSDFLLHDMGEGLADYRSEGLADGYEWRTPPLWGIGLTHVVSPEAGFLHDGRARTLLEAILWHGGEAQDARDGVVEMTPGDRANLIRFLESL